MKQDEKTHRLPDVAVQRSPMGGAWVWALNKDGRIALEGYYGEAASFIPPIGRDAWIVEPYMAEDLAAYLMGEGIAWEVQ